MAEIALGYESEYQLLRFLGHHRNELEQYQKLSSDMFVEEKNEAKERRKIKQQCFGG